MSADPAAMAGALLALSGGEIVAFPTESSYGLAVPALDGDAVDRLLALKGREPGKPPPLLVAGQAMLGTVVAVVPAVARRLIDRHWPGPLTLVLPARAGLPAALTLDGGVGVRQSPHPVAQALVAAWGAPITATSANPAGHPAALDAAAVRAMFAGAVHVLDGGPAGGAAPSTVVRVAESGALTVLRHGALDPNLL